ncbi:hypothetical protein [Yersinia phage vB_YenM_P778]
MSQQVLGKDKFNRDLVKGDYVLYPPTSGSRTGRGGMDIRRVWSYNRYLQVVQSNAFDVALNEESNGREARVWPSGIVSTSVIKVSERFAKGWEDGSVFNI